MQRKLVKKKSRSFYEYSDFGGKTEHTDYDIESTILRELTEETNGKIILSKEELKNVKPKYCSKSKYLLFVIPTKDKFYDQIKEMGDRETLDGHLRDVKWIKPKLSQVHVRLKNFFR